MRCRRRTRPRRPNTIRRSTGIRCSKCQTKASSLAPGRKATALTNMKSQAQLLDVVKTNGCYTCHQLGNKATRTIPKEFADMKPEEAWARRIMSGQAQIQMANNPGRLDVPRAIKMFADWTDRIAAGELPASKPTRPQGAERNVVVSVWDWSSPKAYLHDEISTDKRKPTVNAYGKLYGSTEESTDFFP